MLDRMAGFVCSDAERRHRRRIVNIGRETKAFARRIVMIAEIIVRLDDIHVVDLRCLHNFARRFRAGDIRAGAHGSPFPKCAADAKLRPQTDNQRQTDQQKPVMPKEETATVTVRIVHDYGMSLTLDAWDSASFRFQAVFRHASASEFPSLLARPRLPRAPRRGLDNTSRAQPSAPVRV